MRSSAVLFNETLCSLHFHTANGLDDKKEVRAAPKVQKRPNRIAVLGRIRSLDWINGTLLLR
jgi:hypothetical protein